MKNLTKSTKISINNQDFIVKFPNVGQLMEIEALKMSLTNNNYADMVRSGLRSSQFNLDLVDAISHFSVMIPDLRKNLEIESITTMDPFLGKELVTVFKKQFYPWYKNFTDELYQIEAESKSDKEDTKE